jgi:hypothetical protein
MAEISGVPTADINNVDGFFTTQGGGGGITPNAMPAAGVNGTTLIGSATIPTNPNVTLDFNISPTASETFTKIVVRRNDDNGILALKADGTLWYNIGPFVSHTSWAVRDSTWRQYGTDTDWTDIAASTNVFSAVKGGALMFNGNGGYYQRGDGITGATNSWVVTNSALTWSKTSMGYYHAMACTTSGHVYYCGYNWNYSTGQGTTAGQTLLWTRDQFNITGVTAVSCGSYTSNRCIASGNIYATGSNSLNSAGPLITVPGDINGPLLQYNGGDIVFVSPPTYWNVFAINTSGQLMFAGAPNTYSRPDNSTRFQQGAAGLGIIDGGATGWTFYDSNQNVSGSERPCVAIKNGQLLVGGGANSYNLKQALGSPASTTTWVNVGSTGITTAGVGDKLLIASW